MDEQWEEGTTADEESTPKPRRRKLSPLKKVSTTPKPHKHHHRKKSNGSVEQSQNTFNGLPRSLVAEEQGPTAEIKHPKHIDSSGKCF